MSAFDAGTIIGTLDLDRDPFTEGLRLARAQSDEFEAHHPTVTPDVDTRVAAEELQRLQDRIDELHGNTATPDVDTRVAAAELEALQRRIDEVTRRRTVDIDVNSNGGSSSGDAAEKAASDAEDSSKIVGLLTSKITLLAGVATQVLPAIIPLLGVATGATLALAGGFAQGALALGSFALVAKSDFAEITKGTAGLTGPALTAAKAYEQLQYAFDVLKNATGPAVFGVITTGLHLVTSLIQPLIPLIDATAGGIQRMLGFLSNYFLHGDAFQGFIKLTTQEVGPVLAQLGLTIAHVGTGLIRIFTAFNPLLLEMIVGIERVSAAFDKWTAGSGLTKFVDYVNREIPPVLDFLRTLGRAIGSLIGDLSPSGNHALGFLTEILDAVVGIAPAIKTLFVLFNPLGSVVEAILPTIVFAIDTIAQALAPVIQVIQMLAQFLGPILSDAVRLAAPVLLAFSDDVLKPLVPVIGKLFQALQPVIAELFKALQQVLPALNPLFIALGKAIVAIAQAIIPLIPSLTKMFDVTLKAAVPILIAVAKGLTLIADGIKYIAPLIIAFVAPFVYAAAEILNNWGPISRFFERLWGDIESFFKAAWGDIKNWVDDICKWPHDIASAWDALVSWLDHVWQDIDRDVRNWWGDIEKFFESIPGFIERIFDDASKWLVHAGQDIITGLWTGIKDVWSDAWSWIQDIGLWIMEGFVDAGQWLLEAGEQIVQGLWNGIQAVWHDLTGWLTGAAKGLAGIVKDVLSIFSPSRVFYDLGFNTMEGFRLGLKDTYEVGVQPLMRQIANDLATSFNPTLTANSSLSGTVSVAIAGQTQATRDLAAQLDELTNTVRALPGQTGDAVGASVGSKFSTALQQQTRAQTVIARKG